MKSKIIKGAILVLALLIVVVGCSPSQPAAQPQASQATGQPKADQPTVAPKADQPEAKKTYPTKNIDFIVGFAPGSGADGTARALSPSLEKALGVSVNIINKPGAGGAISWAELAKAKRMVSTGSGSCPNAECTILSQTEYDS